MLRRARHHPCDVVAGAGTVTPAIAVADMFGEPDQPVKAVAGDFRGKRYIDLDLLRRWHKAAVA